MRDDHPTYNSSNTQPILIDGGANSSCFRALLGRVVHVKPLYELVAGAALDFSPFD
jgi:hypothetical protein